MSDFRDFPAIFGEVVAEVVKEYNLNLYYEFGSYLELMEKCKIKDNNQLEKYPLIWLVWDGAMDSQQKWTDPYLYTISPKVFICHWTMKDNNTDQRYSQTINPVIYPIFDILISELGYHQNININSSFTYPVTDHPFWLNNEAGEFDTLSAIEIKLENLLIIKTC